MTPKECAVCGQLDEKPEEVVVTDESGGGFTFTCRDCRDRIERRGKVFDSDVCVFCTADATEGKADALYYLNDTREPYVNLCDECRLGIVFEDGPIEVVSVR